MEIKTVSDFRKAIRNGPYAWPGGYPCFFLMADGDTCSYDALNDNRRLVIGALCNDDCPDSLQWTPVAFDVNWEDPMMFCAHTGDKIESAYGDEGSEPFDPN